jgi:tetratricopeptide (TPR) repeat protein
LKTLTLADYDSAIVDYNKAIDLNPNFAEAYLSRGQLLYNNANRRIEAISDVQHSAKISKLQGNLEIYNKAIDWLEKWQRVEQPWHQKVIDWFIK